MSGPTGEASATATTRSLNQFEKIEAFVKYIVDNDIVTAGGMPELPFRDAQRRDKLLFYDETFSARRVSVTSIERSIHMWAAVPDKLDDGGRRLFLFEEQALDTRRGVWGCSSYSSLLLLAKELQTGLSGASTPFDHFARDDKAEASFAADPFQFLISIGAKIGPPQTVRSIYLMRAFCFQLPNSFPGLEHQVVVGYPIVIERA